MAESDKRKQSLYFPDDMLGEITKEAFRLDRSLSWIVQHAWRAASQRIHKFPTAGDLVSAPEVAPRAVETRSDAAQEREPGSQVREFLAGKFEND